MTGCDVAVIGAGVIGGSIAFELASRGASVTLLDSRGAGLGATQASAGMLVPYIEGFGRPILKLAARSLAMYDGFIERVTRDSGIGVGYQRTGSLQVETADEPTEALQAAAACATEAGIRCTLLDSRQAREAEPQLTPDVRSALLIPDHGFVVATELSGALLAASINHGARVRAPERVHQIAPSEDGVEIQLDGGGRLTARHVVLAAGCWSGRLEISGVPALPVRPVRGQLLQLASAGPSLRRITWGSRCYLVPVSSGTVLVGATVEEAGFDERATVAGVHDLLGAASDLVPHLWQETFAGVRVGLRPATTDELPIMGRSKKLPGLIYATGHFRNGVLLAPLTARVVADLILENREDEALCTTSPQRFGEY
jgi:glycine oxidase